MLSVRELALDQNPGAAGWVNERIIYTHGIGVAMVPVNEVANEGQPRLFIRDLPPIVDRRRAGDHGAADLLRRASRATTWSSAPGRPSSTTRRARGDRRRSEDARRAGRERPGITLDTTLSRLLFALRFRDLDLLISDQITADSQLLFHRSLADRLPRIAPFLLYDKDPYVVIDDDGRLVYVQDAYTASDRFPHAQGFDPARDPGSSGPRLGDRRSTTSATASRSPWTPTTGRCTFYVDDPDDPILRAWQGVFPTLFQPMTAIPEDLAAHLRVPEELFNVQTRVFGRYHVHEPAALLPEDDLWTVPTAQTQRVQPAERGVLRDHAHAREPTRPEFLLLQPMIPTTGRT